MKKLALLIGNSDYLNCNKLKNPINDIKCMKELLEQAGFEILFNADMEYREMRMIIDKFGQKLAEYDCGLFFYAGHGIQMDGVNYLIPIDADIADKCQVEYQCIRVDQMLSWMNNNIDNTNIIILDACRNNPFKERSTREISKGGLAPMSAPRGTFIIFSTSPGECASDGNGNNSPFMVATYKYLLTPNLKIEDTFKLIRSEVLSITGNKQLSWETTSLIGDFYFIRKAISQEEIEITSDKIYNYMESIWGYYEKEYYSDKAEALVFIDASEHFNMPIIEIVRNYSIIQNNKSGLKISNEEIDVLTLTRLKDIGFEEKYYRWSFEGKNVRVGEPLEIPSSLEFQKPELGKEIEVRIKIDSMFQFDKYYVKGETNLPDGTELMISLMGDSSQYYGQSKIIVESNNFISAGFTNRGERLNSGRHTIEITSPITSVQSNEVRNIFGDRGRNLIGEYVKFDLIYGNTIKYFREINICN